MHCFEDVTAVLFCVGLSEFDQVLFEDNTTNRMHEALKVFQEICKSKWFADVSIILFLNKSDLFREKLMQGKSISVCWPDYKGNNQFEDSIKFIAGKFRTARASPPITVHVTCATDMVVVRKVFNLIKEYMLTVSMRMAGIEPSFA